MDNSQIYIGTPNGVVVCVNSFDHENISGCFYHAYQEEPVVFENFDQLIFRMDDFFDKINYPRAAVNVRSFSEPHNHNIHSERTAKRIMSDDSLLKKHGDIGTFIIRVQQRQNSTWQGRVTWADQNKTLNFRSVIELLHLIESAIESEDGDEYEENKPSW